MSMKSEWNFNTGAGPAVVSSAEKVGVNNVIECFTAKPTPRLLDRINKRIPSFPSSIYCETEFGDIFEKGFLRTMHSH